MTAREIIKRGFEFFAQRDYEKAIYLFKKAIEVDNTFIKAYMALAEALNRTDRIDEACDVIKKWLEIDKADPLAHAALSRIYVQQGLIELAQKELALYQKLSVQSE